MRTIPWRLLAAVFFLCPACDSTTPAAETPVKATDNVVNFASPYAGAVVVSPDFKLPPLSPGGPFPEQCQVDGQCALWTGPCLEAHCVRGACVRTASPDGAACEDFDKCTVATTCHQGLCQGVDTCVEVPDYWPFYPVPPYPLDPEQPR